MLCTSCKLVSNSTKVTSYKAKAHCDGRLGLIVVNYISLLTLHVNSKPYVIYYKDSDRVCFSEKFKVKVYAIQEKFFAVTDIITVILCKRLHYMMRLCFRRR